jgi:hypothetical protein
MDCFVASLPAMTGDYRGINGRPAGSQAILSLKRHDRYLPTPFLRCPEWV